MKQYIIITLLVGLFTISFAFAQQEVNIKKLEEVDLSAFIKDVQVIKKEGDNFKMVWWIPNQYWKLAMQGSELVPANFLNDIEDIFKGYILIGTIHTELNIYGGMRKKPTQLQLKDAEGTIYDELDQETLPSEYISMLNQIKPAMENTLGQFGKQIRFHVFNEKSKDGKTIASPTQTGKFTVVFNTETQFVFRLPLSSMVEEKQCPVDNELLNGNWEYCPWHGKKLTLQN